MSLELTWFVISYSCGYDAFKKHGLEYYCERFMWAPHASFLCTRLLGAASLGLHTTMPKVTAKLFHEKQLGNALVDQETPAMCHVTNGNDKPMRFNNKGKAGSNAKSCALVADFDKTRLENVSSLPPGYAFKFWVAPGSKCRLYGKGPFKCYVTLISWELDPHPPPS